MMAQSPEIWPTTLLDLLGVSLILSEVAPYLSIRDRLALCAASKSYRNLESAPELYSYVDLSKCKSAFVPDMSVDHGGVNWRSERMDESLTEDDVYSGPLRGIFAKLERKQALHNIHTLILDGLAVPADLVQQILSEDRFSVRILSIREARHLNHGKLMQALNYAIRPTRPSGTPKLRALYVFGEKDGKASRKSPSDLAAALAEEVGGVMTSQGAQIGADWNQRSHDALLTSLTQCSDPWYQPSGQLLTVKQWGWITQWAQTINACEGIIAFDGVLCRGPRHDVSKFPPPDPYSSEDDRSPYLPQALATVALGPHGCHKCRSCPESPAIFGKSPAHELPLLSPPPSHSPRVKDAQRPDISSRSGFPPLYARCLVCMKARWCEKCFKWWCEDCYTGPQSSSYTTEVRPSVPHSNDPSGPVGDIRVHMGLCVESCLVAEEMAGSGSGGMWG